MDTSLGSMKFYIHIHLWNTTLSKVENISVTLRVPSCPFTGSPVPPHSASGNHCSVFCHFKWVWSFLEFPIHAIIHDVLFCVFSLTEAAWYLSTKCPVVSYAHTTTGLSIPQLLDIWVASSFQPSWIKLFWPSMYKSSCRPVFLFIFGKYLGMELLGHMVSIV